MANSLSFWAGTWIFSCPQTLEFLILRPSDLGTHPSSPLVLRPFTTGFPGSPVFRQQTYWGSIIIKRSPVRNLLLGISEWLWSLSVMSDSLRPHVGRHFTFWATREVFLCISIYMLLVLFLWWALTNISRLPGHLKHTFCSNLNKAPSTKYVHILISRTYEYDTLYTLHNM